MRPLLTTERSSKVFCRYCRKEIPDDSRFCKECGKDLTVVANGGDSFQDIHIRGVGAVGRGAQAIVGEMPGLDLTQEQIRTITHLFEDFQKQLGAVGDLGEAKRKEAQGKAEELREELTNEKPQHSTIEYLKTWLLKNVPAMAGTLTSIFATPIVGKVVEAAGEIAAQKLRERFDTGG